MDKMQVPLHMCPQKMFKALGGKQSDFTETVLMCGQRHRVDIVLDKLDGVRKILGFSGHSVFRGQFQGKEVLVANSGMYAPDTAIVMELLLAAGVKEFIRLGSCGSLSRNVKIGDIVLADSALRGEGTSFYYLARDVVPRSDVCLLNGLKDNLLNLRLHIGPVWTTDALFREVPEIIDPIIEQGAIAVDMVSSLLLSLAQSKGVRALSVLAVSDLVLTAQSGFKDPAYKKAENAIVDAALNYIKSC